MLVRRSLSLLVFAAFAAVRLAGQAPAPKAPASLRSVLLKQLRSTHSQAEWFVPIDTAVAGLTPEQARWIPPATAGPNGARNPAPADHSVGMLANHLLFWNARELAKFKGEKAAPFNGNNDETFNKFDAASWSATVAKLDQVMSELEHVVETADEAHLAAWADEIAHIGTHNAYHTGQIVVIRKLEGTWDPSKGVK